MGTIALKLHVFCELYLSWETPPDSTKHVARTLRLFASHTLVPPPSSMLWLMPVESTEMW